jgi:hypothetical protein
MGGLKSGLKSGLPENKNAPAGALCREKFYLRSVSYGALEIGKEPLSVEMGKRLFQIAEPLVTFHIGGQQRQCSRSWHTRASPCDRHPPGKGPVRSNVGKYLIQARTGSLLDKGWPVSGWHLHKPGASVRALAEPRFNPLPVNTLPGISGWLPGMHFFDH